MTRDIQDGIEAHIADGTRQGDGVYVIDDAGDLLRLKLVRVHTEYLANLGPGRHFACVDLATADGDVFDVDFFLDGEPGAMTVSERTIHKRNGQPRYVWEQQSDKTWVRVDADGAAPELLGVIHDRDAFEFIYRATLPEIAGEARMWLPMATSDAYQRVELLSIDVPGDHRVLHEQEHGNQILFVELGPDDGERDVEIRYQVERLEKAVYPEPELDRAKYLGADRLVPLTAEFRAIAEEVVAGKDGELVRARALYDHVIDHVRYAKVGTGYGKGDAVYACDEASGNCTDFHSYFIALARSVGIPARFSIGASIPSMRNEGGISGYHCWAEFHADGHWWPVDISEADKCSSLASFFFGNHPANRIELSRGRDLVVEPGPRSGPINFLAYPVLEVDGETVKAKVDFSFVRGEVYASEGEAKGRLGTR
ncbi:MAG: transglutaminase-like domain-containing protein [Planctomycetota bacterium]